MKELSAVFIPHGEKGFAYRYMVNYGLVIWQSAVRKYPYFHICAKKELANAFSSDRRVLLNGIRGYFHKIDFEGTKDELIALLRDIEPKVRIDHLDGTPGG